jgi:hypothetical protein
MRACSIAITSVLLFGTTLPAIAGPAIKGFTPEATSSDLANTYGFSFVLLDSETIHGLGAYDAGNPGLNGSAQVGIWDATGNLLTSTTVPAGTAATRSGGFSYNGIAPLTLDALTAYYIGSYQPSDPITAFQIANSGSASLDDNIISIQDAYGIGPAFSGLVFPDRSVGFAGADVGANFTSNIVPIVADLPEPATVAILGTSLAALATLRRRTRQK